MGVILLIVAAVGILVGDRSVGGVGLWPLLIALLFLTTPLLGRAVERREDAPARAARTEMEELRREEKGLDERDVSLVRLASQIAIAALVICAAGFALASAGQRLAEATGLGSSFFGTVFLAAATSLPELSTAVAAARLNRADLAVGDILGSNMVNLTMLLLVDFVYAGDAIFNELDTFSAVSALLAAVLTAIFMIGLVERRNRSVLRMGYDSIAVIAVYAAGLGLLYHLR
jgi:cation:H+ antiporter